MPVTEEGVENLTVRVRQKLPHTEASKRILFGQDGERHRLAPRKSFFNRPPLNFGPMLRDGIGGGSSQFDGLAHFQQRT